MKLKEFLLSLDKVKVLKALEDYYEEGMGLRYLGVWDELVNTEPSTNDVTMIIIVSKVLDEDTDEYFSVDGEDPKAEEDEDTGLKGREISWALEYSPWDEWLAMEVEIATECTEEEAMAHILYEMTFCGFSNEQVANAKEELKAKIDEVENIIKWEELKELNEEMWEKVKVLVED